MSTEEDFEEKLYFEIKDGANFLRIEPLGLINYNSENDWDRNWVKSKVYTKSGAFEGSYEADIMTTDYERLKQELKKSYNNLKHSFLFSDLERAIDLKIIGDGLGHFSVTAVATDNPGIYSTTLEFEMQYDQTFIPDMINKLDSITKKFPIKGDFTIQNS